MRWPWVSREVMSGLIAANDALGLATTQLIGERDWLRAELHNALDHTRRLERKEAGLTEKPREPKPRVVLPARLDKIIGNFGGSVTQEMQRAGATHLYANLLAGGKSEDDAADEVEAFLLQGLNEQ